MLQLGKEKDSSPHVFLSSNQLILIVATTHVYHMYHLFKTENIKCLQLMSSLPFFLGLATGRFYRCCTGEGV